MDDRRRARGAWVGNPDAALDDPATIRAYFEDVWGGALPPWLQLTGDASPEQLAAYYQLRTDAMGEGALAKKHKEIIIMLMSCAEHYDFGIDVHARGALAAGATKTELIDAVRASVIAGGIVAWVAGFGLVTRAREPVSERVSPNAAAHAVTVSQAGCGS